MGVVSRFVVGDDVPVVVPGVEGVEGEGEEDGTSSVMEISTIREDAHTP